MAYDVTIEWTTECPTAVVYGDPDPLTGEFDVAVYWQLC